MDAVSPCFKMHVGLKAHRSFSAAPASHSGPDPIILSKLMPKFLILICFRALGHHKWFQGGVTLKCTKYFWLHKKNSQNAFHGTRFAFWILFLVTHPSKNRKWAFHWWQACFPLRGALQMRFLILQVKNFDQWPLSFGIKNNGNSHTTAIAFQGEVRRQSLGVTAVVHLEDYNWHGSGICVA